MKSVTLLVLFLSLNAAASTSKYPRIEEVSGKAQLQTARDATYKTASKTQALVERASFRTTADARIKLSVSEELQIEILPDSEVLFPGISWESGIVPTIRLVKGSLRWIQKSNLTSRLESDIFELSPPAGDFIFRMNPQTAVAGVQVLKGEISFKAMNAETAVSVPAGKKISFQGVIEEGEIAYDILLQGKKIPRGVLGHLEELTAAEMEPYRDQERAIQAKKAAAAKAAQAQKSREKKAGYICDSPKGRFNECAWVCVNNPKASKNCQTQRAGVTCERTRCNANGVWSDRLALPAEEGSRRCGAQAKVDACDY